MLDTNSYSNVIPGRDFMKTFGSVKFDFVKNRVRLGKTWLNGSNGLAIIHKRKVQLNEVKCWIKWSLRVAGSSYPELVWSFPDFVIEYDRIRYYTEGSNDYGTYPPGRIISL